MRYVKKQMVIEFTDLDDDVQDLIREAVDGHYTEGQMIPLQSLIEDFDLDEAAASELEEICLDENLSTDEVSLDFSW